MKYNAFEGVKLADRRCIDCGVPVSNFSKARCLPCSKRAQARERPEEFAEMVMQCGSYVTSRKLKVSLSTISQWRKELGLSGKSSPKQMRKLRRGLRKIVQQTYAIQGRDELAADFLRRAAPIYRCRESGEPAPDGGYWRRGNVVLSKDEVIARAVRAGWSDERG